MKGMVSFLPLAWAVKAIFTFQNYVKILGLNVNFILTSMDAMSGHSMSPANTFSTMVFSQLQKNMESSLSFRLQLPFPQIIMDVGISFHTLDRILVTSIQNY